MHAVILKPKREESVLRRHPWVFSGAVQKTIGRPQPGETVQVLSSRGRWLAYGAWSPQSQIRLRLWSFDAEAHIEASFFHRRLKSAIAARRLLLGAGRSNACRLVNSESDQLPGLIVDRYGPFLVCQFLSTGAEYWKSVMIECLLALTRANGIFERSDEPVREKEGMTSSRGCLAGDEPPELIEIYEGPLRFLVDVRRGHKTGFYLDQRENRTLAADYATDASVLNCFAYTGGFGLWALHGGARRLVNVESSPDLLQLLEKNIALNGYADHAVENIKADVFKQLRAYRDRSQAFDMIVLDPPKFAASAGQVRKAARAYKDINLLAIKCLNPGGMLLTFSCSGHMGLDLFKKIVADAALDAQRTVQLIRSVGASGDHPVSLHFPEGSYLKGLVCRVG
jgi:23S rRNA (cytosine1962-C5)-methyltransferase